MLKKIIAISLLTTMLFSDMIINKPFKEEILNNKIDYNEEVINYNTLNKIIDEQYGYYLYTNIPEIKKDRNFFIYEERTIGYILNKFLNDYEAVINVDDKKGIIKIVQIYDFFIKMPLGWKMNQTVDILKNGLDDISFRISGNRIYAYGSENAINKIKDIMLAVEEDANREYSIILSIYEYNGEEDDTLTNMRDPSFYESAKKVAYTKLQLKHGQKYGFNFKGKYIGTELDSMSKSVLVNGKNIEINNLNNIGYEFKGEDDKYYLVYINLQSLI